MFTLKKLGTVHNSFKEKFGIPRQSGLNEIRSVISFEPEFANPDAFKGLEEFSHLWVIWQFSENLRDEFSPTVRPPRLGGNKRIGVFATRSSFRPNSLALSSVKIEGITFDKDNGPLITVTGLDCMDGTPVFDIKPYITYTDSHPDAICGFVDKTEMVPLKVEISKAMTDILGDRISNELISVLREDPRPRYKKDGDKEFAITFDSFNIIFKVNDGTAIVISVEKI